jgi:hypothetical protein
MLFITPQTDGGAYYHAITQAKLNDEVAKSAYQFTWICGSKHGVIHYRKKRKCPLPCYLRFDLVASLTFRARAKASWLHFIFSCGNLT